MSVCKGRRISRQSHVTRPHVSCSLLVRTCSQPSQAGIEQLIPCVGSTVCSQTHQGHVISVEGRPCYVGPGLTWALPTCLARKLRMTFWTLRLSPPPPPVAPGRVEGKYVLLETEGYAVFSSNNCTGT